MMLTSRPEKEPIKTTVAPAEGDGPGFDECVASGQSCSYGPHGPKGEMQCRYCGKEQNVRRTHES